MNKNLIIYGMALLLLSVGLSGCIEDPFEGTWTGGILKIDYIPGMNISITELTFADGTAYLNLRLKVKVSVKTMAISDFFAKVHSSVSVSAHPKTPDDASWSFQCTDEQFFARSRKSRDCAEA